MRHLLQIIYVAKRQRSKRVCEVLFMLRMTTPPAEREAFLSDLNAIDDILGYSARKPGRDLRGHARPQVL